MAIVFLNHREVRVDFGFGTYQKISIDYIKVANKLLNKKTNIMSQITEKFALALTKEPMKTFRKLGITNGDDLLTVDGTSIFLAWLLNTKFATDFKKEVADDMLKDKEAEDK